MDWNTVYTVDENILAYTTTIPSDDLYDDMDCI